jgi:hypothetical protein
MLVLDGHVEVRFEHTGVRTVLSAGEMIHFYAEQPHSAVSKSETSRQFIIRFYEVNPEVTRQYMRDDVETALRERQGQEGLRFKSDLTSGWIRQSIAAPVVREPQRCTTRWGWRVSSSFSGPPMSAESRHLWSS